MTIDYHGLIHANKLLAEKNRFIKLPGWDIAPVSRRTAETLNYDKSEMTIN